MSVRMSVRSYSNTTVTCSSFPLPSLPPRGSKSLEQCTDTHTHTKTAKEITSRLHTDVERRFLLVSLRKHWPNTHTHTHTQPPSHTHAIPCTSSPGVGINLYTQSGLHHKDAQERLPQSEFDEFHEQQLKLMKDVVCRPSLAVPLQLKPIHCFTLLT